MSGEKPYFIEGTVTQVNVYERTIYVKVPNGNVYHIFPFTPGIEFNKLERGKVVILEVTTKLVNVLSAKLKE